MSITYNCAIYDGLDKDLQDKLQSISRVRCFDAQQTIIAEGEDSDLIGSVLSGALRVQKTMQDGRKQVVALLVPSDVFGRVFTSPSPVAIEAASNAVLRCYSRSALERLLVNHPQLEHSMFLGALRELDAAQEWMLLLGSQSAAEKIASFLLILLRKTVRLQGTEPAIGEPVRVLVPVRRQDMSSFLGMTPETSSRNIQDMVRKGVIKSVDLYQFEILNEELLVAISGRPELATRRNRNDYEIGTRISNDRPHKPLTKYQAGQVGHDRWQPDVPRAAAVSRQL